MCCLAGNKNVFFSFIIIFDQQLIGIHYFNRSSILKLIKCVLTKPNIYLTNFLFRKKMPKISVID